MATYKLTNDAVKDLTEIWEYTYDTWSEKQADKYYKLLLDACSELARNPENGKDFKEIYPGLKGQKIAKHLIFYRQTNENSIEVTRILHEQMDIEHQLTH